MRKLIFKIYRWIVFKIGDTRRISHLPFFTWDEPQHKIDLNEALLEAMPLLMPGDIVLHRDDGYVANIGIGGAMIHAGIYMGDQQLIEAISEGVVKRHVGHILHSDRACILRPLLGDATEIAIYEALAWADRIVGFPYDPLFDFNAKRERRLILEFGEEGAIKRGVRFCCTEIPYFCFLDYCEQLDIHRRRNVSWLVKVIQFFGLHPGTLVIDADMYMDANFELIWASQEYTPKWCKKMKVSKMHQKKIEEFWAKSTQQK